MDEDDLIDAGALISTPPPYLGPRIVGAIEGKPPPLLMHVETP